MAKAMHGVRGLRAALVLGATGLLSAAALTTAGTSAVAAQQPSATPELAGCATHAHGAAHVGRFRGIAHPVSKKADCRAGAPAIGTPPLLFNGGAVMGTRSTGAVVVTPIFWTPSGHPIDAAYKSILPPYPGHVAAARGHRTNVFSSLTEYYGSNGSIRYSLRLGSAVTDTS